MSAPKASPSWPEIEALFFAALEAPLEQREPIIESAALGSPSLAAEVRTLLQAHEEATGETFRRVGPYRMEHLLGRGGMGEVWLARRADGQFEQSVALKLIRSGWGADILLPRFRQERQLLARLSHPNITRLLDGGIAADGRPYLAMEYVEGEPLLAYSEKRNLNIRARLELFRTLCSAVEYAHQNLIVHRDIKPDNVLVTADGLVKLLDFGIAKLNEGAEAAATIAPLMTYRYASPEQLNRGLVGTASDVYSLGVLLFELLTGRLPYAVTGDSVSDLMTAITSREPLRANAASPARARGVHWEDLDAILARALAKDPRNRYASVERFSADIDNYLEGRPVAAHARTLAYRVRKYARRHWVGVAATAAVALSLSTAALVALRAAYAANHARARAERVTGFLVDMLNAADPYSWERATWTTNAGMKMLDLLPAVSGRIASVFAGDAVSQAQLHTVLAGAYARLGEFEKAEPESKKAIQLLPALKDNPEVRAYVLFIAGYLDFRLSLYEAEERELREAVHLVETTPSMRSNAEQRASYLALLAAVLADVRKKDEAARTAERVRQFIPQFDPLHAGSMENGLSLVYLKIGDLERSRNSAKDAVRLLSTYTKPLPMLGESQVLLGTLERFLGNPQAALEAFASGFDTYMRALGPDDPLVAPVRIELAYQRALNGEPEQSLPELWRCLATVRLRSNPEDTFRALHELGAALGLAGKPREGEPLLREALAMGSHFLSPSGPTIGICNLELGECLELQGRLAEALPAYRVARDNLRAYYGDVFITRAAQQRFDHAGQSPAAAQGKMLAHGPGSR